MWNGRKLNSLKLNKGAMVNNQQKKTKDRKPRKVGHLY